MILLNLLDRSSSSGQRVKDSVEDHGSRGPGYYVQGLTTSCMRSKANSFIHNQLGTQGCVEIPRPIDPMCETDIVFPYLVRGREGCPDS